MNRGLNARSSRLPAHGLQLTAHRSGLTASLKGPDSEAQKRVLLQREPELQPADALGESEIVVVLPPIEADEQAGASPAARQAAGFDVRDERREAGGNVVDDLEPNPGFRTAAPPAVPARRHRLEHEPRRAVDRSQILVY